MSLYVSLYAVDCGCFTADAQQLSFQPLENYDTVLVLRPPDSGKGSG